MSTLAEPRFGEVDTSANAPNFLEGDWHDEATINTSRAALSMAEYEMDDETANILLDIRQTGRARPTFPVIDLPQGN